MDVLSRSLAVVALVCAIAAGTVGSTASTAGATAAAGDCSAGSDWGTLRADLAAQTVDLVNAHRATLGLRQLTVGSALQASAVWKARHMAKYSYMAHDDPAPPVSRSTGERMAACGVTGELGREHRCRVPVAHVGRQRLAQFARASCEHREPELRLDGLRRGGQRLRVRSTGRTRSRRPRAGPRHLRRPLPRRLLLRLALLPSLRLCRSVRCPFQRRRARRSRARSHRRRPDLARSRLRLRRSRRRRIRSRSAR